MKKQIVFFGAILLVFVLAGCGNEASEKVDRDKSANSATPVEEKEDENEGGLFSGSLKDLMARGADTQCTWSSTNEGAKIGGTVYVSGTKFYQEFSSTDSKNGSELKSYILNDGTWIYQWSALSKVGTKMKMDEVKKLAEEAQKKISNDAIDKQDVENNNVNLDNEFDYNCQKWTVDVSRFQLPTDIQFNDLSQMLNNLPKAVGGNSAIDVCQMCEKLPTEGKAACLESCKK
jgi:hypothetical protein